MVSGLHNDAKKFYDDVLDRFSGNQPEFLSRIGGSDTRAVVDFIQARRKGAEAIEAHFNAYIHIVENYNGFYANGANKQQVYVDYLRELSDCYFGADMTTFGHTDFLSLFFPDFIHPKFFNDHVHDRNLIEEFVEKVVARPSFFGGYPYTLVECLLARPYTLFSAFSSILIGRRVLVVSPFAESIRKNWVNRRSFFHEDYDYPEFELQTLNTPITYRGLPIESYPHENWVETRVALAQELETLDFDIALLACGSYAMPLGLHIRDVKKKQAIYVGGVLQLFFGIMGRRYEDPFFVNQINRRAFISPVERDRFLEMLPRSDATAREAFGAYF